MDWATVLGIMLGNAGIFLPVFFWMRTEANADRREITTILREMKDEMKDFHARLCVIEDRNKK